jgi:hypothetical protein
MYRQERISSLIAAIVIGVVSSSALSHADWLPPGNGRLVLSDLSLSSKTPGLDRPPCKAPPLCLMLIADLKASMKIGSPSQIGLFITPVDGDIELGALSLQIFSHGKLVFETEPVSEVLKVTNKAKAADAGYLFVLDAKASEAGNKFFVPENTIGFTAKTGGKDKAKATFSLVNIVDAKPRDPRSNKPRSPQKGKP